VERAVHASLFGLWPRKGALLPGSDADILIYDPEPKATIRAEDQHTLAGYTPFEGIEVQGRVRTVLSRGEVIVEDGTLRASPGRGRFVRGVPFAPLPGCQ